MCVTKLDLLIIIVVVIVVFLSIRPGLGGDRSRQSPSWHRPGSAPGGGGGGCGSGRGSRPEPVGGETQATRAVVTTKGAGPRRSSIMSS